MARKNIQTPTRQEIIAVSGFSLQNVAAQLRDRFSGQDRFH